MKKFVLKLFLWIPFWVLYGILFWVLYVTITEIVSGRGISWRVTLAIQYGLSAGPIFWGIGGTIGGIVGLIILLFGEVISGKIGIAINVFFWPLFWVVFLTIIANVTMQRSYTTTMGVVGVIIHSSVPIVIFGATGGVIGFIIIETIKQRFLREDKTEPE